MQQNTRPVRTTLHQLARRYLISDAPPLSASERWRSTTAALAGMLLLQAILALVPAKSGVSHLLAPLGATSIILFALPHSPLGQPWPLAGGLLLSALIGWLCGTWVQPEALAIAAAVALSVWVMARLRCIHPPGGAMAIVGVLGAAHPDFLLTVMLNVMAMLIAVLAINNLLPGRRYPVGSPFPRRPSCRQSGDPPLITRICNTRWRRSMLTSTSARKISSTSMNALRHTHWNVTKSASAQKS